MTNDRECTTSHNFFDRSWTLITIPIPIIPYPHSTKTTPPWNKQLQIKSIEEEIGLGQIEEVIEIAKDELELVSYYYENKGWELVATEQSRAATLVKEQEASIYFTQPMPTPPPPPPPTPPPK